jgi:copper chaperone
LQQEHVRLTLGLTPSAKVDLTTEMAARRRIGSDHMKSVTLKIEGMHCGGCAETIKSLVEKQPGVQAVSVSFDDGRARILFDPNAAREDQLVFIVEQPGFRVVGRETEGG